MFSQRLNIFVEVRTYYPFRKRDICIQSVESLDLSHYRGKIFVNESRKTTIDIFLTINSHKHLKQIIQEYKLNKLCSSYI